MGAKVRIIIDIVSLNGKKKVSLAVVVCIISVIQIQKDLRLFRAAPFAFVAVGTVVESTLSDIRRHPHPRLPVGRLKIRKYKKSAFGGKKKSGSRRYKNNCKQGARKQQLLLQSCQGCVPSTMDYLCRQRL